MGTFAKICPGFCFSADIQDLFHSALHPSISPRACLTAVVRVFISFSYINTPLSFPEVDTHPQRGHV